MTPCRFGGLRAWFVCPGGVSPCGRRVTKLYLGGTYFLCQRCHGLGYQSQQMGQWDRMLRKVEKIRSRLGAPPGSSALPAKPKGMHRSTYQQLLRQAEEAEAAARVRVPRWALAN